MPRSRQRRLDLQASLLAIVFFLVANLVRLALLHDTGDRSLQVDYALVPLVYWGMRKLGLPQAMQVVLGIVVAAVVISGDLLDIMSRRFNWSHGVIIDYAYSTPDLPWPAILPFVALGVTAIGLCLVPFVAHRHAFAIWPLALLVATLLAANTLLYQGTRGDVDRSRLTHSFVSHAVNGAYNRLVIGRTLVPFKGKTMATDMPAAPPAQILSVAVESLGLARAPADRALLLQPLIDGLGGAYVVRAGVHAFDGPTLAGEVRELCGLQADGIPDTPALAARLRTRCLPARLRRMGYDTQALHGNGPLMYDRGAVYPAVGFRKTWFAADLRRAAAAIRPCPDTAFAGVCDADVYARALSLFDGRRRFVHVLTLDSHLPLPIDRPPVCQAAFNGNVGLCRYAQVIRASLKALGAAIAAAPHRPDLIVLYGDHAPPFGAPAARARFAPHAVPYIVLTRLP